MESYADFIKYQYQLGKITEEDVRSFIPAYLTEEEANNIVNKQ